MTAGALGPAPSPEQLAIITATERPVLVEASAGTGKTFTVVRRILHLLGVPLEGVPPRALPPRRLDEVAAITFTNAAAADLREALRRALREAGRDDEALEVDLARVGTIHAFCADVLGEFALRAGRAPGERLLDEAEGAALRHEAAADAVLAAVAAAPEGPLAAAAVESGLEAVTAWVAACAADGAHLERLAPAGPAAEAILAAARAARERLRSRLAAERALDFDHVLTETRDLLRADAGVRRALQRRLHTLIVDEYQDVDPVQQEIALLLGTAEPGHPAPRLLLVGDPKQSIYRFRRADVRGWRDTAARLAALGAGAPLPLSVNRRSAPAILRFARATVGQALDEPLDGEAHAPFEVPYAHAHPPAEARDDEAPAIEAVVTETADRRPRVGEHAASDALAIAERLRARRAEGVPWSEMAILVPRWEQVPRLQEVLAREGIPHHAQRGEGFFERREVLDVVLALEAVRDPRDRRALVGFLRGPMAGLRDDTLVALAHAGGADLDAALDAPSLPEPERRAAARALLDDLRARRDRVPAHELIARLLDRTGYLALLAELGDAQAIANVRQLAALARAAAGEPLGDLLRCWREVRASGARVGDAPLHDRGEDVVTITTIHGAKGLEWDTVAWMELRYRPKERTEALRVGREQLVLAGDDAAPELQELGVLLARQEEQESRAEQRRLWYVAATRAKRRLLLAGLARGEPDADAPEALLDRTLGLLAAEPGIVRSGRGGEAVAVRVHVVPLRVPEPGGADGPGPVALAVTPPAPPVRVPAGTGRESATSLMAHARCPRRHRYRYVLGVRDPGGLRLAGRGADGVPGARLTGTIVHDVLEHAAAEADLARHIEEAIDRHADDGAPGAETPAGRAWREAIRAEVGRVRSHPAWRAAVATAHREELAFLHVTPSGALHGAVDLAAAGDEGLHLLDVKTGEGGGTDARERAARYGRQRDVYVMAVEAIGGRPVDRFSFLFSRTGELADASLDAPGRAAALARVRRALDAIAADEAPMTDDPAECAACGYRSAGWCAGRAGGA